MDEKLKNDHLGRKHAYMTEQGLQGEFIAECALCEALKGSGSQGGGTLSVLVKDEIPIKALFG